jgi:tetratricopeptide (TPR) repeat protein
MWPRGLAFGAFITLASALPLAAQSTDSLPVLKREYPGSGPYVCPAAVTLTPPSASERARARQLGSDADQAGILGNFDREEQLLAQAAVLDPTSAEFAYRRGRALENLGRAQPAMREYCRAIDLGFDSGPGSEARDRIDDLYEQIRDRLPARAQDAFVAALAAADDTLWVEAVEAVDSLSVAIDLAPTWPEPVYNRAVIEEYLGRTRDALADYRTYLDVVDDPTDADGIGVAQRIGTLEAMANISVGSPNQALALGLLPGMGQFYTDRPNAGTATLVTSAFFVATGALIREITVLCVDEVPEGQPCPPDLVVDEITERPYFWVGVGLGAALTIAGAVEAYLYAKRARESNLAILGTDETETGLSVGLPTVSTHGSQVDFAFVRYRFR